MTRNNADFHGYEIRHKRSHYGNGSVETQAIDPQTKQVIGSIHWSNDEDSAPQVLAMNTHPEFQHLGVMSALVAAANKKAGQTLIAANRVSDDGEGFTKHAVAKGMLAPDPLYGVYNEDSDHEVKF